MTCPDKCDCSISIHPSSYSYDIPVFKPTLVQFKHFKKLTYYLDNNYGQFYGLLKIIPPLDYTSKVDRTKLLALSSKWSDNSLTTENKPPYCTTMDGIDIYNEHHSDLESSGLTMIKSSSKKVDKSQLDALEERYWNKIECFETKVQDTLDVIELNDLSDFLDLFKDSTTILTAEKWSTSFTSNIENRDTYTLNLLHIGAPKVWYSIPPNDIKKLDLLHSKDLQTLSPKTLIKYNIKAYRTVQEQNEIIISFPYSYHFGFNFGFNCSESTSFIIENWADTIAEFAKSCTCINDSVKMNQALFDSKPIAPRRLRIRLTNEIDKLLENKEEFEELENLNVICQICQRCDDSRVSPCPVIPFIRPQKSLSYAHIVCAIFSSEVDVIVDPIKLKTMKMKRFRQSPINLWGFEQYIYCELRDVSNFVPVFPCMLCRLYEGKPSGITVKCKHLKCQNYMHAICAFEKGHLCFRSKVESSNLLTELANLPSTAQLLEESRNANDMLPKTSGLKVPIDQQLWFDDMVQLDQKVSVFECYCRKHGEVYVIYIGIEVK